MKRKIKKVIPFYVNDRRSFTIKETAVRQETLSFSVPEQVPVDAVVSMLGSYDSSTGVFTRVYTW